LQERKPIADAQPNGNALARFIACVLPVTPLLQEGNNPLKSLSLNFLTKLHLLVAAIAPQPNGILIALEKLNY
jgi:hypothetical protein